MPGRTWYQEKTRHPSRTTAVKGDHYIKHQKTKSRVKGIYSPHDINSTIISD